MLIERVRKSYSRTHIWIYSCPRCNRFMGIDFPYRSNYSHNAYDFANDIRTPHAISYKNSDWAAGYTFNDCVNFHLQRCFSNNEIYFRTDREKTFRTCRILKIKSKRYGPNAGI